MMQRFMVMVILVAAVSAGFGTSHAAPARISSLKDSNNLSQPTVIAQDLQGNLYISETSLNKVRIFDRTGHYQRSLMIERPLGIAVDRFGALYVCSEKKKRIEVYNPDLTFSRILGEAQGEVRSPAIVVDNDGRIYAVDNFATKDGSTMHDTVRVYDAAGTFLFSFGTTGSSDGSFYRPSGLAINEELSEVYVVDRPVVQMNNGPVSGARIQVFDKKGTWLRTLPIRYGGAEGQMTSPAAVAIDRTGKLYVADSYQRSVLIFDGQTGAFSGALYDMTVPLQIPLGVAVGADNIARVTSYGGASVEVYALDNFVTMDTSPASLLFTGLQYTAVNPDPRAIVITNAGSGTLNWTARTDQPWLTINGQPATRATVTGTAGPASSIGLNVGVDIANAGLLPGTYSGIVTVASDFGQKNSIPVTLTMVPPPILSLSNGWLNFIAKKGKNPPPQTIAVEIQNAAALPWTAVIDPHSPWLSITPTSGITTTAATVPCTVTAQTAGLAVGGPYAGSISLFAPGALGSGGKLTVNVTIVPPTKINVITNRPEATFSLIGPSLYSGASTSWSVEDAPAGEYTISYDALAGYKKPFTTTKTLPIDGEITFHGNYTSWNDLSAKKNIITAKGPWIKNDALVKIYKANGTQVMPDFMALDSRYGANIASGDIDGDGTAEIITGAGAGPENTTAVRLFSANKTLLREFNPYPGMSGGITVAASDFDHDGKAEIIVAPAGGSENPAMVKVFAYDKDTGTVVPTGVEIIAHTTLTGVHITAVDSEGNQTPRLVTAPVSGTDAEPGSIRIWKVDTSGGIGKWSATIVNEIPLANRYGVTIAAGDTDGDGRDEIIVGMAPERKTGASSTSEAPERSVVRIVRADGTEVRRIPAFDGRAGVNVAAADLDGDGITEIIAAVGPDPGVREAPLSNVREERKNKRDRTIKQKIDIRSEQYDLQNGTVRIYSAAGMLIYAITPYEDARYGVKVAVGDLGL